MTVPPGVSLALTAGPLTDPVTWTRIDNLAGLEIESITIKRGRPTERDKTMPGTVTITGIDSEGVLDPTNTGSPLYPDLVPTKQAAVTLYNPNTGVWNWLFRGHVSSITHDLDPSKKWTTFELELVDMLDILNDAEIIPDQAGNTVPSESEGDVYYTGQHIDDRLLAVLADTGTAFMGQIWPVSLLQIASGNVNVQGRVYSRGTSLLQVIDEACDAEFPGATNRFITFDGAFAFRGRYYRVVPTAYIPADNTTRSSGTRMLHWHVGDLEAYDADNTLAVPQNVKFKIDKTDLINTALVSPIGISDAELASGSQFDSDATSIGDYGPRTSGMSLENLITDTADDGNTALQETATFATATVHNYKDPVTFVNEIVFRNPVKSDGDYAARWKLLSGIELSDLFTYTGSNPGGGGFSAVDHYVEELGYELKPLQGDEWDVTLTVGLSSRQHFTYIPASWNPPASGGGSTLAAHFSWVANSLAVQFYDESTPGPSGPITGWSWNFGDSNTSTSVNPAHTYASAGTYTVTLTVTGTSPDGTASVSKSVTVA
ncbi:MAG TPA: PKD domain-containing protein [Acidimicrobiales bacterium]|nr:PKD domain-containing protein [Acidimicrobiales bacterium]